MTQPCDVCADADAYGSTECGTINFCQTCADDSDQLEQEHVRDEVYYYLKESNNG